MNSASPSRISPELCTLFLRVLIQEFVFSQDFCGRLPPELWRLLTSVSGYQLEIISRSCLIVKDKNANKAGKNAHHSSRHTRVYLLRTTGDISRYFKPDHDIFLTQPEGFFVPIPKQSIITRLWQERHLWFCRHVLSYNFILASGLTYTEYLHSRSGKQHAALSYHQSTQICAWTKRFLTAAPYLHAVLHLTPGWFSVFSPCLTNRSYLNFGEVKTSDIRAPTHFIFIKASLANIKRNWTVSVCTIKESSANLNGLKGWLGSSSCCITTHSTSLPNNYISLKELLLYAWYKYMKICKRIVSYPYISAAYWCF